MKRVSWVLALMCMLVMATGVGTVSSAQATTDSHPVKTANLGIANVVGGPSLDTPVDNEGDPDGYGDGLGCSSDPGLGLGSQYDADAEDDDTVDVGTTVTRVLIDLLVKITLLF